MLNECHILTQLLPGLPVSASVAVGPGDDCAALRTSGGGPLLLAAVDQVIAEVHFAAASTSPERAGAKLVKRNLSDIAAMGGTPRWALLAFAARNRSETWILEFCRGAADAGMRYGVPLVGGDIAELASDGVCASLAILGEVAENEIVLRRGAKPGDRLYVTGCIGNSFRSEHHLDFTPRLAEGRFLAAHHFASAMLDISDGLLLDASRLATSSQVALTVEPERIPLRPERSRRPPGATGRITNCCLRCRRMPRRSWRSCGLRNLPRSPGSVPFRPVPARCWIPEEIL